MSEKLHTYGLVKFGTGTSLGSRTEYIHRNVDMFQRRNLQLEPFFHAGPGTKGLIQIGKPTIFCITYVRVI